jgi:hypothetical protein
LITCLFIKSVIRRKFGTNIPFICLAPVLSILISMVLRIFILPDTKFTFQNPLVTFETNKFLCEFQANVESFGDLTLDSYLKTNGILGQVNFVSGSIKILKTIEIEINKTEPRRINGIFVPNFLIIIDSVNRFNICLKFTYKLVGFKDH